MSSARRASRPPAFSARLICAHTSRAISCLVHCLAGLPYRMPGFSHSEMSMDRQSFTVPSP